MCIYKFCIYTVREKSYPAGSKNLGEARLLSSTSPGPTSSQAGDMFPGGRCTPSTRTYHIYTYTRIHPHGPDRHLEHSRKHRQHQGPYPAPLSFPKHPMQSQNVLPLHPLYPPPLCSSRPLTLKCDLGAAPNAWWSWVLCWAEGLRLSWDSPVRGP